MSHAIADGLMPGIITTTDRARYYSLYTWAVADARRASATHARDRLHEEFRKREAAIALATLLAHRGASPVGKVVVSKKVDEINAADESSIALSFRVLPSDPLGGYGSYYGSSIVQMGLLRRTEDGFEEVTPSGRVLVDAVDQGLASTPLVTENAFGRDRVEVGWLKASAERLSIDSLGRAFAERERRELISLILGLREHSDDGSAPWRRMSLARILHVLLACERAGRLPTEDSIDLDLLYFPAYYDLVMASRRRLIAYEPPAWLRQAHGLWREFCLHEYLTAGIELLFVAFLDAISGAPRGRSLSEALSWLLDRRFFDTLRKRTGHACRTPADLLHVFLGRSRVSEATCVAARGRWGGRSALCEATLTTEADETASPQGRVAASCTLLGMLYAKWRDAGKDEAHAEVAQKRKRELCAAAVLPTMDAWRRPGLSWHEALTPFVDTWILQQHEKVMAEKGKLESSRFHLEDGRYVPDQRYVRSWRASRHRQALQVLTDLGVVARGAGGRIAVTDTGRRVYRQAMEMTS